MVDMQGEESQAVVDGAEEVKSLENDREVNSVVNLEQNSAKAFNKGVENRGLSEVDNNSEKVINANEKAVVAANGIEPYAIDEFYNFLFVEALPSYNEDYLQELNNLQHNDINSYKLETEKIISDYGNQVLDEAIDEVLRGDVVSSWNKMVYLANFSDAEMEYISNVQNGGQVIYREYLDTKFNNIPYIKIYMDFINDAGSLYTGKEIYNPYDFAKRITSYDSLLNDEQKAQVCLSCARLFTPKDDKFRPHPDYKFYLEKALGYSANYETVADCQRYLTAADTKSGNRAIKNAYKRVIDKAKKEKDYKSIYGASVKLKEIYHNSVHEKIGFKNFSFEEDAKINQAIEYQKLAIQADKKINGKVSVRELKALSKLYKQNGYIESWIENQKLVAKQLKGKDKYIVLSSILPYTKDKSSEFMLDLVDKISKDRMSRQDKLFLTGLLRQKSDIYIKDAKKLEEVNQAIDKIKTDFSLPRTKTSKTCR